MNTKQSIYNELSHIMRSGHELYEVMNESATEIKLRLPKKLPLILENIFISKVTIDNLNGIRQLIDNATKLIEDKILGAKSLEMTNIRFNEELDEAKNEILYLKNELAQLAKESKQIDSIPNEVDVALKHKNNELQIEKEQQDLTFGKEIILMRDNLCMKEEMLKTEEEYQESKAWKLIQASYRETESILNRMGITVINEKGVFDSNIQMVTDTTPTDKEELYETVAQTFREGYRTADKLIRPQEVILYSYSK